MTVVNRAIGVDLGGSKIAMALVDGSGRTERAVHRPTDVEHGPAAVKEQIVEAVKEISRDLDATALRLGIGVAGQIEAGTGVVRFAPNLGWHGVPFQSQLHEALGMPVIITNDVRAATWGEWLYGAGRGCDDLVCIFVGTGIGGGIVANGRVVNGSNNSGGELGHMTVQVNGPRCTCANLGCLEALAGGWAIARRAREAASENPGAASMLLEIAGSKMENITAKTLAQAFHAGDELARRLVNEVADVLSAGAVSLANALNPKRIIFGGGVIEGIPELVGMVDRGVRERAFKTATEFLEVTISELGGNAGVIGAAALAMHSF